MRRRRVRQEPERVAGMEGGESRPRRAAGDEAPPAGVGDELLDEVRPHHGIVQAALLCDGKERQTFHEHAREHPRAAAPGRPVAAVYRHPFHPARR